MNRWVSLLILSALTFGIARPVRAQGMTAHWAENKRRDYASPQWFALEIKFGGYTPHIDSSPGLNGATPFSDLYNPQGTKGQPPERLLSSFEFDVQFFHKYGSLAAGLSIGYGRRSTHAFNYLTAAGVGSCTPGLNCTRSGDQTTLNLLPVELMLVYRFDLLALRYRVPLVPFMKVGLAYDFWWIEAGAGGVATVQTNANGATQDGWGGTMGFVLNPGLAFMLDVIDPPAARTMDAELGINHTYLFAELHYADISWFHRSSPNTLVLSDVSWNVGLAFEF